MPLLQTWQPAQMQLTESARIRVLCGAGDCLIIEGPAGTAGVGRFTVRPAPGVRLWQTCGGCVIALRRPHPVASLPHSSTQT